MSRITCHSSVSQSVVAAIVLAVACVCPAVAQQSNWSLCNNTKEAIDLAIAFPEGEAIHARGWITLQPTTCHTRGFSQPPQEVHWRATSRTKLFPASTGNIQLCVDRPKPFEIADARPWRTRCSRTYKVEPFYTIPFTGNKTVTRIFDNMGAPPSRPQNIDGR